MSDCACISVRKEEVQDNIHKICGGLVKQEIINNLKPKKGKKVKEKK